MIDLPAGTAFQGDLIDPMTGARLVRILPAWFGASAACPQAVPPTEVSGQVGEDPLADLPPPLGPATWRWTPDGYLPIPT